MDFASPDHLAADGAVDHSRDRLAGPLGGEHPYRAVHAEAYPALRIAAADLAATGQAGAVADDLKQAADFKDNHRQKMDIE